MCRHYALRIARHMHTASGRWRNGSADRVQPLNSRLNSMKTDQKSDARCVSRETAKFGMEVLKAPTSSSKRPPCAICPIWTLWMGKSKGRRVVVLRKSAACIVVLFNGCIDGARLRQRRGYKQGDSWTNE